MSIRIEDPGNGDGELSEINVTPFIDVILVLLIVFMVAAPLSTVDVAVDLPVAGTKSQGRPDKPVFVTLKADLTISVGESEVARHDLADVLDKANEGDRTRRIFLRADRAVPYGDVMELISGLASAGFLKVALVGLERTQ